MSRVREVRSENGEVFYDDDLARTRHTRRLKEDCEDESPLTEDILRNPAAYVTKRRNAEHGLKSPHTVVQLCKWLVNFLQNNGVLQQFMHEDMLPELANRGGQEPPYAFSQFSAYPTS